MISCIENFTEVCGENECYTLPRQSELLIQFMILNPLKYLIYCSEVQQRIGIIKLCVATLTAKVFSIRMKNRRQRVS